MEEWRFKCHDENIILKYTFYHKAQHEKWKHPEIKYETNLILQLWNTEIKWKVWCKSLICKFVVNHENRF